MSYLAWFALVPLFAVLWSGPRASGLKALLKKGVFGYCCGLVFFGGSFWWINEVSTLGYIPVTLYLSLYTAVWAMLAGGPLRPARPPYPDRAKDPAVRRQWANADMGRTFLSAIFAGASWVCLEWLRGAGTLGFPWNYLGASMDLTLAQAAEWVGAVGLSFLPVFLSAVLWSAGSRVFLSVSRDGKRTVQWDFIAAMGLIALVFIWGTWRAATLNRHAPFTSLKILAIQENTPQYIKWNAARREEILDGYMNSTREAVKTLEENSIKRSLESGKPARLQRPDWVIWPESSLPWPFYKLEGERSPNPDQPLADFNNLWNEFSEEDGPFVLFAGVDEAIFSPETRKLSRLYNTLHAFDGRFSASPSYRKHHLVPFGEYIPWRESLPFLEKAFAFSAGTPMGANFGRGSSTKPLSLPTNGRVISVIPSICFEDTVPSLMRKFVTTENPQVILNVTNDGWFNRSWASELHFKNARLRAIELRRPMIRAANTGVTAIIGADGSTADINYPEEGIRELRDGSGSPFLKGSLYGTLDLPLSPQWTLYSKWGDWFVVQCLLLTLFGLLRPFIVRKRAPRPGEVRDGIYTKRSQKEDPASGN